MEVRDTIIIGAGQAGLAAARELGALGIDHLVLERGRIAERWRTRWDSLRLLTPNWMTRLPGHRYGGPDPDGYMTKDELVELLEGYARGTGSEILENVEVRRLCREQGWFIVDTSAGVFRSRNVVVATGYAAEASTPPRLSERLDRRIQQLHSSEYRKPADLGEGGVLVVGAGASGLQLAAEVARSGRQVVLSAGRHARALRRYRGMDIWWWLEEVGSLEATVDDVADLAAARRTPSLGLTGASGGSEIDLGILQRMGVEVVGRMTTVDGLVVGCGDNLAMDAELADRRLRRLLDRFDDVATERGLDDELAAPVRPVPIRISSHAPSIDLAARGITTVLWCTGYRRSYDWLDVPVLDEHGEIIQRRGVTPVRGLFVLGQRFQWTRRSSFIDGVGDDARHVAAAIAHAGAAASR